MTTPSSAKPLPKNSLSKQKLDFTSEGAPPPGMVSGLLAANQEVPADLSRESDASPTPVRIAVIVGSLRRESYNLKLAKAIEKIAPSEFLFMHANIADLPLYNQDDDDKSAESVVRMKAVIASAQGLLFVTPEYNRSVPGVLKNAIDHCSRPYGQSVWSGKPAGIIGASVGVNGTSMAQQHLRNILAYLDVPLMCQPEAFMHAREGFFDESGEFGKSSAKFMATWVAQFCAWINSRTAAVSLAK
jgi:chromate reductase, NAD(P)H dehydrogenase (quinone)